MCWIYYHASALVYFPPPAAEQFCCKRLFINLSYFFQGRPVWHPSRLLPHRPEPLLRGPPQQARQGRTEREPLLSPSAGGQAQLRQEGGGGGEGGVRLTADGGGGGGGVGLGGKRRSEDRTRAVGDVR